jgi:hypothetical protein
MPMRELTVPIADIIAMTPDEELLPLHQGDRRATLASTSLTPFLADASTAASVL